MTRTACITTPIYYVNDRPHIGHIFTTTLCDAWARAMRLQNCDVFFLTGTDEHGVKVEKSAAEHHVTPQAWADTNAAEFQRILPLFHITNTDFIRTTEPRHERQVQNFIERLQKSGALYKGSFEGWYDEGQEEYLTDPRAKECEYKSPINGQPLVRAKEQNWYFKLSAFSDRLKAHFESQPNFVQPSARMNEVVGRLREGLQDVPMTRTNFTWGIPMPGDPGHVIYVWIDALFNYITALDYSDVGEKNPRAKYWPADWHVIGKEILWFHAVIWPAMLMALDLPLPKNIHAHSFWISEGKKMSKSLGNFIDLPTIENYIARYGLDAWRWFMLTRGPIDATDADFRANAFHETYTADLVNTVGNCSSRVTAMIAKTFNGQMPEDIERGGVWPARCEQAVADWQKHFAQFQLADAADDAMKLLRDVDVFINQTEPFKLAKDPAQRARVASILAQCLESVRIASLLLEAFLPQKMAEFSALLGVSADTSWDIRSRWGLLKTGSAVTKVALYPRIESTPSSATI